MTQHGEPRWYFAYGANMASTVFVERRGMRPLATETARLSGWRLAFEQPGIPCVEPVFATVIRAPNETVHGVLYRLTADDIALLERFEGAGAYRYETLQVAASNSGRVDALVLVAKKRLTGRLPSERYLQILRRGARERGLPDGWLTSLDTQRGKDSGWLGAVFEGFLVRAEMRPRVWAVVEPGLRALNRFNQWRADEDG